MTSELRFTELGLAQPILKAIAEQGYTTPSPVQAQAIPAVLQGRDVMAAAQTGTGKTAGFTLPILHRLQLGGQTSSNRCRALILTPTRELAAQIDENIKSYSKHLAVNSAVVFGGVKINPQMQALRRGVDILVACPGRLLDLYQQNAIRFDELEYLVLDEADRMLDMGFINDIRKILKLLPVKRQNLLFSATFSDEIRSLAKGIIHNPVEVDVSPRNSTAHNVTQWLVPVDKGRKAKALITLIADGNWHQVLVFTRTKHGANRLAKQLGDAGIRAAAIHGNKSQGARTRALAEFKSNDVRVLVATDIAARGLDIDQLPHVVNYELPNVAADYVHRIGRTGRAGSTGDALSLVCAEELQDLEGIEGLIGRVIERRPLNGFEPQAPLPISRPRSPKKPKKQKKPKSSDFGNNAKRSGDSRNHSNSTVKKPGTGNSSRRSTGQAKPFGTAPRKEGAAPRPRRRQAQSS